MNLLDFVEKKKEGRGGTKELKYEARGVAESRKIIYQMNWK